MTQYQDLLQKQLLGNSVQDLLNAALVFVAMLVLLHVFKKFVLERLQGWAHHSRYKFNDALMRVVTGISVAFYIAVSLFVSTRALHLPADADTIIYGFFILTVVFEFIRLLEKITLFFVEKVWLKDSANKEHVSHVLGLLLRLVLWTIGALLVLSNMGFEVSSLVASLGIGGVAVALAVQNILGDMFSSFSIYFDRPFEVGDFIIVGDHMGTVKKIGLKTTRIQALQGEEIVISNTELTSTRIRNFKKMQKRRIVFGIGVTYDTSADKLKRIPEIIQGVIDPIKKAEFNRAHFKSFGDSTLDIEIVYYVLTGDYIEYMDTQQEINIAIVEVFGKENIKMAFPTRTIHMVQ